MRCAMASESDSRQTSGAHDRTFPRLFGGQLCLDFVNTLDPRASDRPRDFLQSYADLVAWARHAGVLTASQSGDLVIASARDPELARTVFAQAIALREVIHRVFLAISQRSDPAQDDLETL